MTASLALLFAPSPNNALLSNLFMFAAIFAIFYFIMWAPQQRQRKQHEQALRNLKKGDEVVTAGGIVGEVVHIRETVKDGETARTMEDRVTIRSAESRLIVERGRITRVTSKTSEAASAQ